MTEWSVLIMVINGGKGKTKLSLDYGVIKGLV